MSTAAWTVIRCDHQDARGYCGSVFRRSGTVTEVRQEAVGYGWQLGEVDLCSRCASRASNAAEAGQ